jgi:hypothetical protein
MANEPAIQQVPAVVSGTIKQINPTHRFLESAALMSTAFPAATLPTDSSAQGINMAQVVQSGTNNHAAILQSGGGNASVWQSGQGNSAYVVQRR